MSDRHHALFANNQHPIQLEAYDAYNQFLQSLHDPNEAKATEADNARFAEISAAKQETLAVDEGETLSADDLADIHIQVAGERRSADNFSRNSKNKDGSIADYLELRRPFGSGQ